MLRQKQVKKGYTNQVWWLIKCIEIVQQNVIVGAIRLADFALCCGKSWDTNQCRFELDGTSTCKKDRVTSVVVVATGIWVTITKNNFMYKYFYFGGQSLPKSSIYLSFVSSIKLTQALPTAITIFFILSFKTHIWVIPLRTVYISYNTILSPLSFSHHFFKA